MYKLFNFSRAFGISARFVARTFALNKKHQILSVTEFLSLRNFCRYGISSFFDVLIKKVWHSTISNHHYKTCLLSHPIVEQRKFYWSTIPVLLSQWNHIETYLYFSGKNEIEQNWKLIFFGEIRQKSVFKQLANYR
jgi:hypothetical protein